jgi:predicted dehydrogenase
MPVEDTADILMRFNSGSTANVHLDYIQRPTKHTLEVTGTGGRLTWDNTGGCAKRYDVEKETWEEVSAPPGFERNHLFLAEMSHFIRVIKREELPACTFEDGVAALEITQAVHRSAREAGLVKFRK